MPVPSLPVSGSSQSQLIKLALLVPLIAVPLVLLWRSKQTPDPSARDLKAEPSPQDGCCGEGCCRQSSEASCGTPAPRRDGKRKPKTFTQTSSTKVSVSGPREAGPPIKIIYVTESGTARNMAQKLCAQLAAEYSSAQLLDMAHFDPDTLMATKQPVTLLFVLSTYTEGAIPSHGKWFYGLLREWFHDHRVERNEFEHISFGVFGLGDSVYGQEHFCTCAKEVDLWMSSLGAKRIVGLACGDTGLYRETKTEAEPLFEVWSQQCAHSLKTGTVVAASTDGLGPSLEDELSDSDTASDDYDLLESEDEMLDVEDLGAVAARLKKAKAESHSDTEPKDMVSKGLRERLTKERYTIVGTHSAVKLCRWTMSMVRGRGGCYKHTFFGIASHRCMETTPSLACANKCVFCWRKQSNPVGKEWKWKVDPPELIFKGVLEGHRQKIKQLKGIAGAIPERFQEAMEPRHCALSLVGEPIWYEHINELLDMLHQSHISSFLVTNGQFPEAIKKLQPVTQLYLSIDASTKESLKRIDRPLFSDFWERYMASIDYLREKKQRTVFRLTLVKDMNTNDINQYSQLVKRGMPEFIEIKGVTYCGDKNPNSTSKDKITMKKVPYYVEVLKFAEDLVKTLPEGQYALACEHEHSISVLIAHTKFLINNEWHTWIDYDRFFDLVQSGREFTSLDYAAKTPEWAVYGNERRGFDPLEERTQGKGGKKNKGSAAIYKESLEKESASIEAD
ncbi:tRNA wybutosine-synthesizing protein 1 [Polychytrium aggregatum]|uniref:tRNA wybutosine-synthesizing protein 1 n=1 Tax=Polychytrium aggregatum TaxID=110093 RepID=UPI0022FDCB39|nr:tRNA wybutosine-synthesizing protein 1 [Polychytrium aggregatum]KAI9209877.1 tRNA wybutosine-synthesizing protein 1 [Polychytrium aggregatum]